MLIYTIALILLAAAGCFAQEAQSMWTNDFKHQVLNARPHIETRYIDAKRTGFDIDADKYHMLVDMKSDSGQRVRKLSIRGLSSSVDLLTGDGIYLQLTDSAGTVYSTLNTKSASRLNIYRRGPYYIESHWLDVELTDSNENTAPIKGEVVFYSYPEKTHIGVILHVTKPVEIKNAMVVLNFDAVTFASIAKSDTSEGVRLNDFCLMKRASEGPTCALIYPAPGGVDDVTIEKAQQGLRVNNYIYSDESHDNTTAKWQEGEKHAAYFEIFPLESSEVSSDLEAEVKPLLSSNIISESGQTLGYDPIRGCYKVQTDNEGDFSYHFYKNQNAYEVASFAIHNDDTPRKVYILHETRKAPGSVECGVVLDEAGNTLPITVQISKNFRGEFEEPFYNPDDTPFSETFFPLYLSADETRKLTSLHLYQNWGNHPLKQFSSLGAWMDYFHMSTGVTETTCYVPFLYAGLDGVTIADFRPMSQKMWKSQPQHDNVAGHSFLRYLDSANQWHFIEYTGATFRSTGPNWADMSMSYLSDDGKARVTIDVFELPSTDELRNFVHIRVDFLDTIEVKDDDIATNMRLLKIATWVQGMRYTNVAYGGPTGGSTIVPIRLNDDFTVAGAALPKKNGWAAVYPDQRGANSYIVRRFDGKIGGETVTPGVSLIGSHDGNTNLFLVPLTKAKKIQAGDFIDADLILMPYGGGTQDEKPAQKCALDFGLNAPKVTEVELGKKLSDFPTRIALDESGRAEFRITGGMNCIPIIIEGSKDYSGLRLYNADGEKTPIELSRKGEKDGYQVFAKEDGTFGFVLLVNTDGKEHKYLVE